MTAPALTADDYGNLYAPVHIEELDEWAWLLGRLEDWLLHAQDETIEDWATFSGHGGARIDDIVYVLGQWSIRMRNLAEGRP